MCTPGPRDPTETETELCLSVSHGDTGWQLSAAGTGFSGCSRLVHGWHKLSWRSSPLTPPSIQFSRSVVSNSLRPHGLQHARPTCPSPTPRVYSNSIQSVMPSNRLILCRSLLLSPSIFPSIMVFSNESALRIRWPKYWSFSLSISPSNEHSVNVYAPMNIQ